MGWPVSRHSEPARKLNLFGRRLGRLRGAVRRGERPERLAHAADQLRLAALAVVKAERALLAEYPDRDRSGRRAANLGREEARWLTLTAEAIVAEYGADAEPGAAADGGA